MKNAESVVLPFTKATGAGNDFIMVDGFRFRGNLDWTRTVPLLCDRHFGIGADGLILLSSHPEADFHMLYFNADGSTGGMCGNGGRCAALFASVRGLADKRVRFVALGHTYTAEVLDARVVLSMRPPGDFRAPTVLEVDGEQYVVEYVDTGSPHAVVFVNNLASLDVARAGAAIRASKLFKPDGANVNFVQESARGVVSVRTFERGVEAETLACGTGSVASAVMHSRHNRFISPVHVHVRSGEILTVWMQSSPEGVDDVRLEGAARLVFSGSIRVSFDPPGIDQWRDAVGDSTGPEEP